MQPGGDLPGRVPFVLICLVRFVYSGVEVCYACLVCNVLHVDTAEYTTTKITERKYCTCLPFSYLQIYHFCCYLFMPVVFSCVSQKIADYRFCLLVVLPYVVSTLLQRSTITIQAPLRAYHGYVFHRLQTKPITIKYVLILNLTVQRPYVTRPRHLSTLQRWAAPAGLSGAGAASQVKSTHSG